jgi:hypothetical protein
MLRYRYRNFKQLSMASLCAGRLPLLRSLKRIRECHPDLLPDAFEVKPAEGVVDDHLGHVRYVLLLESSPEFLRECGGDDRNRGNAFLFDIQLVNYQP